MGDTGYDKEQDWGGWLDWEPARTILGLVGVRTEGWPVRKRPLALESPKPSWEEAPEDGPSHTLAKACTTVLASWQHKEEVAGCRQP